MSDLDAAIMKHAASRIADRIIADMFSGDGDGLGLNASTAASPVKTPTLAEMMESIQKIKREAELMQFMGMLENGTPPILRVDDLAPEFATEPVDPADPKGTRRTTNQRAFIMFEEPTLKGAFAFLSTRMSPPAKYMLVHPNNHAIFKPAIEAAGYEFEHNKPIKKKGNP